MNKLTQAEAFGKAQADAVMRAAHMTFNAPRGKAMVLETIKELQKRVQEIQPKKATSAYKKARYGKK